MDFHKVTYCKIVQISEFVLFMCDLLIHVIFIVKGMVTCLDILWDSGLQKNDTEN